jgi:hypothetical protein
MNLQDGLEWQEKLKFGDLVRIKWADQTIVGFFQNIDIVLHYGKPKWASIVLLAKIPSYPTLSTDFKKEKPMKHGFSFDDNLKEIEIVDRVLNDDWYYWEGERK